MNLGMSNGFVVTRLPTIPLAPIKARAGADPIVRVSNPPTTPQYGRVILAISLSFSMEKSGDWHTLMVFSS